MWLQPRPQTLQHHTRVGRVLAAPSLWLLLLPWRKEKRAMTIVKGDAMSLSVACMMKSLDNPRGPM